MLLPKSIPSNWQLYMYYSLPILFSPINREATYLNINMSTSCFKVQCNYSFLQVFGLILTGPIFLVENSEK